MSAPASAAASASATFVTPQIFTRVLMDALFNPTLPQSRTFCLVGFRLFFKDKPMRRTIYFDYNATTPLDPGVRDAMLPFLGGGAADFWGNPSSVHHVGRKARALLDDARDRAAKFLGAKPSEIIFTSGGTESNNLAIFGTARALKSKGKHLITSAVEHDAVLQSFDYLEKNEGFEVTRLPVDSAGRILPDDLKRAIRPDTTLVSIMAANNEIGTLQPVAELGAICRERGIVFHSDAVQWFGKEPLKTSGNSTRIWFPFARTNFTDRKARDCFTSNRRCIPIRSCSAADMKMNAAPARKIWRASLAWLPRWKNS